MNATPINEALLDEKLAILEKARAWSPRTVSKLELHVRTAGDEELYRLNPLLWAATRNISGREAVDLFLYATWAGLFQMNWALYCPICGDEVESFRTLRHVNLHFHCNLCRVENDTALDEFIHVNFTVSPTIRRITFHEQGNLTARDYYFKYRFHPTARLPDGRTFVDYLRGNTLDCDYVEPEETKVFDFVAQPGWIVCSDIPNNALVVIAVKGAERSARTTLRYVFNRNLAVTETPEITPGPLTLEIRNAGSVRSPVLIFHELPDLKSAMLDFGPALTGKQVLATQVFRDLFRNEIVQGTEGLAVRDITILFTDIKGSTALYDRIGDLKAFAMVREHFDHMRRVINANEGAVVKTIGDAIMATFTKPLDAVQAALAMIAEIDRFNAASGRTDILLKIGMHRGAAIAVTLNERLDYFGQTVNLASRVEGLAEAKEIYLTEDVLKAPGVEAALASHTIEPRIAHLKGVSEAMRVFRIVPQNARAA
ncbi:MAG TPA: DUF5939 domain-containing protein [Gammaproteobacteria bacterium]|nr:DUF5939 domain-containing protein [Gammaproteobacteria bacterium]